MESTFGGMVNIMRVDLNRIKEMNMLRLIIYIRMVLMMVKWGMLWRMVKEYLDLMMVMCTRVNICRDGKLDMEDIF
jgi:hypothetical protein